MSLVRLGGGGWAWVGFLYPIQQKQIELVQQHPTDGKNVPQRNYRVYFQLLFYSHYKKKILVWYFEGRISPLGVPLTSVEKYVCMVCVKVLVVCWFSRPLLAFCPLTIVLAGSFSKSSFRSQGHISL